MLGGANATTGVGALQFGHDAEVVENTLKAIGIEAVARLQFGHDAEVVENRGRRSWTRPGG